MAKQKEIQMDPRERKRKADRERLAGKMSRLAELEKWVIFGNMKIAALTERANIGDAIRNEAMEVGSLRIALQAEVAARDFWCEMADARKKRIAKIECIGYGLSVCLGAAIGVIAWLV